MPRRLLALAFVGLGFVATQPYTTAQAPAVAELETVDEAPQKGFNYPYLLRWPQSGETGSSFLLVEPNNTGISTDDFAVHIAWAERNARTGFGAFVARSLNIPLLIPVLPRPRTGWQVYTHLLDRDTLLVDAGATRRIDLQLIAMIDDAIARLRARRILVQPEVLMTGFSASGTFVNRFLMLHPDRVHAAAAGGVHGMLILPVDTLDSVALSYPLGISDVATLTGAPPQLEIWRRVPQFIYMGGDDDNDALLFGDAYSDAERLIAYRLLGERMQPERWERNQSLYREAGANVTFRTYPGLAHTISPPIPADVVEFFRRSIQ